MASVRLTKDLRDKIINAVRSDFDEVMGGYGITKELTEEGGEIARELLAVEHKKYEAAATDAIETAEKVAAKHGGGIHTSHVRKAFTAEVYMYESFKFLAVDPESDSADLIAIHTSDYPFQNLTDKDRRVLPWSKLGKARDASVNDPVFAEKILPSFLQTRALEQSKKLAVEYANNMLEKCNTLAQLIRKWPDAVNVVPEMYITQMNDRTVTAQRKEPEQPNAIMGMDEALKSIRLQAEAVKALKG